MRMRLVTAAILGLLPTSGFSGSVENARFIAEQHLDALGYAQRLDALERRTLSSLRSGLEPFGATILDSDRFMHELTGEYTDSALPDLVTAASDAFVEHLTPQELAQLAAFYRSEAGKVLPAQPVWDLEGNAHPPLSDDGPLAPLFEKSPQLKASMDHIMTRGLTTIADLFTAERLAGIVADPEIVGFEDETMRADVVEALGRAE